MKNQTVPGIIRAEVKNALASNTRDVPTNYPVAVVGNTNIAPADTYLRLDQLDPQSVINGSPIMEGVQFDISPSTTAVAEGLMRWNSTDRTLDLSMGTDGVVTQQIGQELFILCVNKTGSSIPEGSAVYCAGRQGTRPKIALAKSDVDATSCVMGITTETIANNAEGFVTTFGYVRQIKTDYSTWAEGDTLWVSKTTAGALTNVEPTAPHHADIVGSVGVVHQNQGSILVQIQKHQTLEELSDINGTALTVTGQFPVWNHSTGYFDFNYNITNYLSILSAASTYVPYTGATTDININTRNFTTTGILNSGNVISTGYLSGTRFRTPSSWLGTSSLRFAGNTGIVTISDITELNAVSTFTFSTWVTQDSVTNTDTLFSKPTGTGSSNSLRINRNSATSFNVQIYNGTTAAYGSFNPQTYFTAGRLHHLVAVYDGSGATNADRLKVYIDGVAITLSFTSTIPATTNNTAGLAATISQATTYAWLGNIKDTRIFSTALSASDVLSLYNNDYTTSMVHQWKLTEGTGTVATDTGSNPVNGTISGDCTWTIKEDLTVNSLLSFGRINLPVGTTREDGIFFGRDSWLHRIGATALTTNASFGIGTTPAAKLHALATTEQLRLGYDASNYIKTTVASNNEVTIENAVAADVHLNCGTDKTLVLDESVWDDIQFQISSGKVSAAHYPTWDTFTTNTSEYSFDVDDYIDLGANEMAHWWKEGTVVHPHLHITTKTANTSGSSRWVKFTIYFAYADANEVWTETSVNVEEEIVNGTVALKHILANGATIALTNNLIGTQVKVRVKRIAATSGTEYADRIFVTQMGIHAEKSRLGSRTIGAS